MDDYLDLKATLEWGAELPLTVEQRKSLKDLCCAIAGISGAGVPSWRLKEEAERRRAAEERVTEVEAVLKNMRDEWVFRRKRLKVSN
jgi:hypothetical protein